MRDNEKKPDPNVYHQFVVTLKVPDVEAGSLKKVAGTLSLHYPGTPHVVKVAGVVNVPVEEADSDESRASRI